MVKLFIYLFRSDEIEMSDLIEYLNKFGLATRNYSNVRILVVVQNANQERILHFPTSPGIEIQS